MALMEEISGEIRGTSVVEFSKSKGMRCVNVTQ